MDCKTEKGISGWKKQEPVGRFSDGTSHKCDAGVQTYAGCPSEGEQAKSGRRSEPELATKAQSPTARTPAPSSPS
jgi:hypothetical protein